MSYALPHLARSVYVPRTLGFLLAVVITLAQVPETALTWCLLCACLAYPHIAFALHSRWPLETKWVCAGMLLDAVLVGLLIIANDYYVLSALAFMSFLVTSTAIIGGMRWVIAVSGLTLFVAALGSQFKALTVWSEGFWFDAVVVLLTLSFLSFLSQQVFRTTRAVEFARRDADLGQKTLAQQKAVLGRFIAPQLFDSISSPSNCMKTRRKRLTICFTDLSGFTRLMDSLPEHEITQRLNEYLNAMANITLAHGGTLDKFMGDGIMVFFGDLETMGPRQDALACIKMALAMQQVLNALSALWREQGLPNELKMRVGIHTGYCTVGSFGSSQRMDYTAIGGAVNIASRLESAAAAGRILMSDATASLVDGLVQTGPSKALTVKGIERPLHCREVLGLSELFGQRTGRMTDNHIQLLR